METKLIDELMAIPSDATVANVQGITMQVITPKQAQKMLDSDDGQIHECLLRNGRFIFESNNCNLKTLYKVQN